LLTSEEHYSLANSGAIYSRLGGTYSLWSRYLGEFKEAVVVARVRDDGHSQPQGERADGPGVRFCALPDHTGPWQYLRARGQARDIAHQAIEGCGAYLLRVPGVVAQLVWQELTHLRRPYATEVLGDPWDSLGPGSWPGVARPVLRTIATRQLKRICGEAAAVHYVTSGALQMCYPASRHANVAAFSDVELEFASEEMLAEKQRRLREQCWQMAEGQGLRIGFVGSFASMCKGADVLLQAATLCRARGLNFSLTLLGEGQHLAAMKRLAATLGITNHTEFPGQVSSRKQLFAFLDSIDLFAMPSRAEGMPRALLEAMARGCPCVGSAVGGIPEVLDAGSLVAAGDLTRLAELILQLAQDGERMAAMSARNIAIAQRFRPEVLQQARQAFLKAVKERSEPGGF
jgi:glycosyltransferase involved in cell wall biosynthesis